MESYAWWSESEHKWIVHYRRDYSYTSNGNIESEIGTEWEERTGVYMGKTKNEYIYYANGKVRNIVFYNDWDESTGEWSALYNEEYTYDANGKITLYMQYNWNGFKSDWEAVSKSEVTYNTQQNFTKSIYYLWNETSSKWEADQKSEIFNDSNGNDTLSIGYSWNKTGANWSESHKYENKFDKQGNQILVIGSNWNKSTQSWIGVSKYEYGYDSYGNYLSTIYYEWSANSNKWMRISKKEIVYDYLYLIQDLIDSIDYDWVVDENPERSYGHKIKEVISYQFNEYSGEWYVSEWKQLYYSGQDITATDEKQQTEITVFPNPAKDHFSLIIKGNTGFANIELINSLGTVVLNKEIISGQPIPVKDLPSGLYVYKIYSQNKVASGKIILR